MHVVPFMRAFHLSCQIRPTLLARRNQTLYHSANLFDRKQWQEMGRGWTFTRITHDRFRQLQVGWRPWRKISTSIQANPQSRPSFRYCPWRAYLWVRIPFMYSTFSWSDFLFSRLEVYRYLAPLRLLVCGGDGSVGWVLKEIDKLQLKVGVSDTDSCVYSCVNRCISGRKCMRLRPAPGDW